MDGPGANQWHQPSPRHLRRRGNRRGGCHPRTAAAAQAADARADGRHNRGDPPFAPPRQTHQPRDPGDEAARQAPRRSCRWRRTRSVPGSGMDRRYHATIFSDDPQIIEMIAADGYEVTRYAAPFAYGVSARIPQVADTRRTCALCARCVCAADGRAVLLLAVMRDVARTASERMAETANVHAVWRSARCSGECWRSASSAFGPSLRRASCARSGWSGQAHPDPVLASVRGPASRATCGTARH